MLIFSKFMIISPKAQKKNKIAFDYCQRSPPIISLEYIKTIEKNMSIPAQEKILPITIKVKELEIKQIKIPKTEKIQAKIKTFFLPIVSDMTPKIKAKNPPKMIKIP